VNPVELERLLRQDLMPLPAEVEWAEFKEAKSNFHFDKLGEYFSALSNEANLKDRPCAWFVFGITDQPPRRIVGSQYRPNRADLDHLKQEIAAQTTNGITFLDIHELNLPEGRVILFQIPPACRGVPTAWKGHYYGRNGDSIGPLNLQEIEHIRQQGGREDWSAQVCAGASLLDLDPRAVAFARRQYKAKNPGLAAEDVPEQGQGLHRRQDHPHGHHPQPGFQQRRLQAKSGGLPAAVRPWDSEKDRESPLGQAVRCPGRRAEAERRPELASGDEEGQDDPQGERADQGRCVGIV
jgi:hypothetical protein